MSRDATRASGGLIVMALALALALSPAAGASAHDQLLSSSPAEGARLDAAPSEVRLTFVDDVLALGAVVIVADATGTDWVAGELRLDGATVTVPLRHGMPDAGYEIRWRVVSGDGHPISGLIGFTIGDGELVTSVDDSTAASPIDDGSPPAQNDASMPVSGLGSLERPLLIGGAGAAIAVAGYALILVLRRRRTLRPADTIGGADGPRSTV